MARDTWYRLDNVGKFYSSQAGSSSQTAFRYSATLTSEVDHEALQIALENTVAAFPGFNVCLRSGMFWHYLERAAEVPRVARESLPICFGLHVDARSVLIRVSYYNSRINLEVSHIVSDGRGSLNFFKALLYAYLQERYAIEGEFASYDGSSHQQSEDSFNKYYEKGKAASTRAQKVYRLGGWRDVADPTFMEYHLPAQGVLALARSYGVSVTALVIAAVICAISEEMPERERHRAIRMDVPVDLRQVFKSTTTRNFFGLAFISHVPSGAETVGELAAAINAQLKAATEAESLKPRMNRMIGFEKSPFLRFAPLFLKDIVLEAADSMAARKTTTTVSNLGRIDFDERLAPYVENLNVLTSTIGLNFTLCTFGEDLSIGISTVYTNLDIIKNLCRFFSAQGIEGSLNINKAGKGFAAEHREAGLAAAPDTPAAPLVPAPALGRAASLKSPLDRRQAAVSAKPPYQGQPARAASLYTPLGQDSATASPAPLAPAPADTRRCKACGISLTGELELCPLCHSRLSGACVPSVFPRNETKKSGTVALNLLAFVSGVCLLLMLLLWQIVPLPADIVFTVCLALVVNYLFIRNILMHRPDFLRVIIRYFLILLALAAIWFLVTWNLAITTFVIPGICLLAIVFDAVLIAIFSSTFIGKYAKYLLFDVLLCFVPLALVALGLTTWPPLAYISAFTASVFLLGLLVFMRKHLLAEIRKLFSL